MERKRNGAQMERSMEINGWIDEGTQSDTDIKKNSAKDGVSRIQTQDYPPPRTLRRTTRSTDLVNHARC